MEFDADADLAEAAQLHASLRTMSYREWFFRGVDDKLGGIVNPRFRRLMTKYYRDERETFGRHGFAILEKLDVYLRAKEPERYAAWRRSARVALEAGCGTGQYPIAFSSRFAQVLVTDISYVSLVQAQANARDAGLANVHLFAANIEALPLPTSSIDFVHCNGVIEHVAHPDSVFAECARVLSQDGAALVLSPNLYSLYTEAHFRVPAFGFWPLPMRRLLAFRLSGARSFAGTQLRSLPELKRHAASFGHYRAYMLPPRLTTTARHGFIRSVIRLALAAPLLGRFVDLLLNGVLLAVMPYHVIVGFKR